MKVTKSQLRQIIKEELSVILENDPFHDFSDEPPEIDYNNLCDMPDRYLIDIAERDGIEVHRYLDDEGDIIDEKFRSALIDQIENV